MNNLLNAITTTDTLQTIAIGSTLITLTVIFTTLRHQRNINKHHLHITTTQAKQIDILRNEIEQLKANNQQKQ